MRADVFDLDCRMVHVLAHATEAPSGLPILSECLALAGLLIEKNRAYGNSALNPVRLFSKADAVEQIKVRLDDKLSRLSRGSEAGEDVILDLLGYLILLRVAQKAPVP